MVAFGNLVRTLGLWLVHTVFIGFAVRGMAESAVDLQRLALHLSALLMDSDEYYSSFVLLPVSSRYHTYEVSLRPSST
jgi:hypothetical protein